MSDQNISKIRFSLKAKILFGLVSLLSITMAINLFYSYNLFVNDKVSYVFETGLKQAESLSNQLNSKVYELSSFTDLVSHFSSQEQDLQQALAKNDDIIAVGKTTLSKEEVTVHKNNALIERMQNNGSYNSEDIKDLVNTAAKKSKLNQLEPFAISPKQKAYIYFFKKSPESIAFFITTKDSIEGLFNNNNLFNNTYVNLAGGDPQQALLREEISKFPGLKGTMEFNNGAEDLLVSFVKQTNSKYAVVSSMEKLKAFQVTRDLVGQTVLFAGAILGILVAIGVYFSATITQPIVRLTEAAREISKRNFETRFHVSTSDEMAILGAAFNNMGTEIGALLDSKENFIRELEVANNKLEDYGKNLEIMVEQRTIELKRANDFMEAMVNSLDQGLVVFDKELNCHDIHTKACETLFDVSPVHKTFIDLLGLENERERDNVKNWSSIMFSEMIPFESVTDLGPKTKITGTGINDKDYKHITLNYYPMRGEDEKLQNVVAVATDKTQEIKAIEAFKQKEAYVDMVVKILSNKFQFQSFITEVDNIFDQLNTSCLNQKDNSMNFELTMMLLHTLNGGFGLYSLSDLQKKAREYETRVSVSRSDEEETQKYKASFLSSIAAFKKDYKDTLKDLDNLLGTKFVHGEVSKEINADKVLELKVAVDLYGDPHIKSLFYENFIKEPVISYFSSYNDLVKNISAKNGKLIKGLEFKNEHLMIDPNPFKEFFNALIHLFRNCVDHGIETESARMEKGKTPEGHIGVAFDILSKDNKQIFSLTVQDDGAGIDPARIKMKLYQLFPAENFETLNTKELINKIFDPFFSTRDEVSVLSGRGVGMSAIKEIVEKLNGEIEIESKVGKGSVFTFLIPMQELF